MSTLTKRDKITGVDAPNCGSAVGGGRGGILHGSGGVGAKTNFRRSIDVRSPLGFSLAQLCHVEFQHAAKRNKFDI